MDRPHVTFATQPGGNAADPAGMAGLFMAYAMQMQQALENQQAATQRGQLGANVVLRNLGFHPPGADSALLKGVSMVLKVRGRGDEQPCYWGT